MSLARSAVLVIVGVVIGYILASTSTSTSNDSNNDQKRTAAANERAVTTSLSEHEIETLCRGRTESKEADHHHDQHQHQHVDESRRTGSSSNGKTSRQNNNNNPDDDDDVGVTSSQSSSSCVGYLHGVKTSFLSSVGRSSLSWRPQQLKHVTSVIAAGTAVSSSLVSPAEASGSSNPLQRHHRSFRQIGDAMKDDKTLQHRFDQPYSAYLDPVRHLSSKISIFEIGLGCDQYMGIGASVKLWGEYLPQSRLAMLEFDAACAMKWQQQHAAKYAPKRGFEVYTGDQESPQVWKRVLASEDEKFRQQQRAAGGGSGGGGGGDDDNTRGSMMLYDMVIDDGGHTMKQHIATFLALWPRVKPGGVYVIEDMNTCWKTRYGGTKRQTPSSKTTNNFVKELMDRLHALPVKETSSGGGVGGYDKDSISSTVWLSGASRKFDEDLKTKSPIHRVDCFHFICFISKRFKD